MSVQDIINRVTDANYKYYNDRDFFKKEIIDCKLKSCIDLKHPPKVNLCMKCHNDKQIGKLIVRRTIKLKKKLQTRIIKNKRSYKLKFFEFINFQLN